VIPICSRYGFAGTTVSHVAEYPLQVSPHPELGRFQLEHDPDTPLLGYYGGIGLQAGDDGKMTGYGITSRAGVDRLIQRCATYGMDRIYANIMFQWTPSALLGPIPVTPIPDEAEALFGYAIEQAHENNIEFYLDIPVFGRRTRDEPFVRSNPDVFTRSVDGEVKTEFFSPASPLVRHYRIAIILEALSQYPIDGVQLDFIRWPGGGPDLLGAYSPWGYEEPMLTAFRNQYGLPGSFRPEPDDPRFIQAKADVVTLFIRELHDALTENGIDIPVGVYNSNSAGRDASLRHVGQDWRAWEAQGLVDEHHPMFYMESKTRLIRSLTTLFEIKRPGSTVFGPLFLDGPGSMSEERIQDTARRMIKAGCDGVWFCRVRRIENLGLWPAVKRISEYSLSAIRQENFDPSFENLVRNGGFEAGLADWEESPMGIDVTHDKSDTPRASHLVIRLNQDQGAEVSQSQRYIAHPAFAMHSLGFAFEYLAHGFVVNEPAQVQLELTYTDGYRRSYEFPLVSDADDSTEWKPINESFSVDYEDGRYLKSTTIRIVTPPGQGELWLDNFELVCDPLHDPTQNDTKPGQL
jgi:glycosyl hydrolase family 10